MLAQSPDAVPSTPLWVVPSSQTQSFAAHSWIAHPTCKSTGEDNSSCGDTGLRWAHNGAMSAAPEASHAQAASVQLYLVARLGDNLAWQLCLVSCSCSASLLPIKVHHHCDLCLGKLRVLCSHLDGISCVPSTMTPDLWQTRFVISWPIACHSSPELGLRCSVHLNCRC